MATFFVGQRVRHVRSVTGLVPVGVEGRVAAIGMMTMQGPTDLGVVWDGFGLYGADVDQVEPILPEGHRPCDTEFKRDLDRLLEGVAA